MSSAEDALAMLGMTAEDAVIADEKLTRKPSRDKRICLCGHAVNKHATDTGEVKCVPARYWCPCKIIRPVIEVEDTRLFLRKTNGPNLEHALVRGMAASYAQKKSVKWIEDVHCDICKKPASEVRIGPTAVTEYKQASLQATGYDSLLCEDCLDRIR